MLNPATRGIAFDELVSAGLGYPVQMGATAGTGTLHLWYSFCTNTFAAELYQAPSSAGPWVPVPTQPPPQVFEAPDNIFLQLPFTYSMPWVQLRVNGSSDADTILGVILEPTVPFAAGQG